MPRHSFSVRQALGGREPVMRVKFAFLCDLSSCLPVFLSRRALQVGWTILYSYLRLWMGSFEINSTGTSWLHKHVSTHKTHVSTHKTHVYSHTQGPCLAGKWRVRHPDVPEHRPQGAGCGPMISAGGTQVRGSLPRVHLKGPFPGPRILLTLRAAEYMLACSLSSV